MSDPTRRWIHSPFVDLFFFGFGWIPVLAAFVAMDRAGWQAQSRPLLFVGIHLLIWLHRHLTFPLVYADPAQFRERKRSYLLLPVLFIGLTAASLLYVREPVLESDALRTPLRLAPSAAQAFFFAKEGEPSRSFLVRFTGRETTPEEAAATLNRALAGKMTVEVSADRLVFRPVEPGTSFTLGSTAGPTSPMEPLGLRKAAGRTYRPGRPYFAAILLASLLWNIYHPVMQKMGLLRIYSRRSGSERGRWDKAFVLTWFAVLVLHLGSTPAVRAQAATASSSGRLIAGAFEVATRVLPWPAGISLAGALIVSVLYFREEWRTRPFPWAKNLYAASILMLYGTFYYDLVVGYAVFAFSHAIEYIAFVGVYAPRKFAANPAESSPLARAARRPALWLGVFFLGLAGVYLFWRHASEDTLLWYITATGFLHFIYDAWIWKVRRPEVGRPLELQYREPQPAPA